MFRTFLAVIALLFSITAASTQEQTVDPLVAELGNNFSSNTAEVNGTTLHYVRGGNGPAVILVHGYPQDWYEYHEIMPHLARKFTVIAVDLRGVGQSSATPGGYDAPNLAEDIHQLTQQLHLGKVYIVGHDIGGMVAYAFARSNPTTTRGVMILDVPLPGIEPWDAAVAGMWHIGFHQTPGLPEELVTGRQATYFRYILDRRYFSDADVAHYAEAYTSPEQLRAGFELYRAFPTNAKFNAAQQDSFAAPLVWATGENSFFADLGPRIVAALRAQGCRNVTSKIIENSKHFVVNEQPQIVTEMIEHHASA